MRAKDQRSPKLTDRKNRPSQKRRPVAFVVFLWGQRSIRAVSVCVWRIESDAISNRNRNLSRIFIKDIGSSVLRRNTGINYEREIWLGFRKGCDFSRKFLLGLILLFIHRLNEFLLFMLLYTSLSYEQQ